MAKKHPTNPILDALREASRDDAKAVAFVEAMRGWNREPSCPRCGGTDVYMMRDRKTGERERNYRWRCRGCGKPYSARTATVFEETRLPLRIWCHAFWRACSSKKGVSALQIARECDITHKSALFLMHRVRLAMYEDPDDAPKLSGDVEADETYVGGKPRYRIPNMGPAHLARVRAERKKKSMVFAMVERGGKVRASTVPKVHKDNLARELRRSVDIERTRLITDKSKLYVKIGPEFPRHETVDHGEREYVRGDVHTNTIEGFFSILKRGVYGTFHSVSPKHLHRYVAEFEFKYNTRKLDDGERVAEAFRGAEGKRLLYVQPSEA